MAEVEVIDRVERRRKWSEAEKAALLAEVEAVGGKVALVARRHRISESLLYNWRAAVRATSTIPCINGIPLLRALRPLASGSVIAESLFKVVDRDATVIFIRKYTPGRS